MSSPYRQSYTRKPSATATWGLRAFFGLFLLVGIAFFYAGTIQPILRVALALRWQETPCVIDSSRVVTLRGSSASHGTSYDIEIAYHYRWEGSTFTSHRYRFNSGANGARAGKQRIVAQYPAGRQTVCYVNPSDPSQAVIDRGLNLEMFYASAALLFALVGGVGLYFTTHTAGLQPATQKSAVPRFEPGSGESIALKAEATPVGKFLFTLLFATIWNGFIGFFFYLTFLASGRSGVPFLAKIFVGGFSFIGVLLIAGVFGSFIAVFNPRVRVTSRANSVPLGGEFQFQWSIGRHAKRIRKLRIFLEGCEQATDRRGKSVQTTTQLFAQIPIFGTIDNEIPTEGQGRVVIPSGLMHTFSGRFNKIIWRLRIHGDIPGLPAIDDAYPINVLPHGTTV